MYKIWEFWLRVDLSKISNDTQTYTITNKYLLFHTLKLHLLNSLLSKMKR